MAKGKSRFKSTSELSEATFGIYKPTPSDRLHVQVTADGSKFKCRVYSIDFGYGSHSMQDLWPQALPERKRVDATGPGETWMFPAVDTTAIAIERAWPASQVIFGDDESRRAYEVLIEQVQLADMTAQLVAAYKVRGIVPEHDYELHPELPLASYQVTALCAAMGNEGYALFMEQGTGKTAVSIARICNEARLFRESEDRMYRVLVVCPNNVRMNWVTELARFSTDPVRVTAIRGGAIQRMKLLADAIRTTADDNDPDEDSWVELSVNGVATVVVVSYESFYASWQTVFKLLPWDLSILDESHFIKSQYTKRWPLMKELRDNSSARMILTGTPIANTPLDLYTQLEFLGHGFSGFASWENFRKFYGQYRTTESGVEALVGFVNLPFLQERLARYTFIISQKEALPELPELTYDVLECEMAPKQAKAYNDLLNKLKIEIEDELEQAGDAKSMVINNVLTKLLKLSQVTSGFITYPEIYDEWGNLVQAKSIDRFDPNPKIELLVEELKKKTPRDKTIVWATWVQDIKTISARLRLEGIVHRTFMGETTPAERAEAERAFNYDDDCRVMVINAAAGGTGLNLVGHPIGVDEYHTTCNQQYFFSQNWSSVQRSQAEKRAHRKGTLERVRCTDLCVPNTIDEEIRVRVLEKRNTALTVSDIRGLLKRIVG